MREYVDLAPYPRVIVKSIAVKVAEFRGVQLQDGALKWRGNIGFDKDRLFEDYQALEMLDKKHHIPVIDIFAHQYYLIFSMRSIKVGVKVA